MELKTWEQAHSWADKANEDRHELDTVNPLWSFDCGFKLDFDGGLVRVVSRFYPPSYNNGAGWLGACSVYAGEIELQEKTFNCPDLSKLKEEVEDYIESMSISIRGLLQNELNNQTQQL